MQDSALDEAFSSSGSEGLVAKEDVRFLLQTDAESFVAHIRAQSVRLDSVFYGSLAKSWERFVAKENKATADSMLVRETSRQASARSLALASERRSEAVIDHQEKLRDWYRNLVASEVEKDKHAWQDNEDQLALTSKLWRNLQMDQTRIGGLFDDADGNLIWKLDLTENALRMRKKLRQTACEDTSIKAHQALNKVEHAPSGEIKPNPMSDAENQTIDTEDRNRRLSRSLQHEDVISDLMNITRVTGLQATDGLLVLGKANLYFVDNYFIGKAGKILTTQERGANSSNDMISQMLSDEGETARAKQQLHTTRAWPYKSVESISKRQFLLRDVALEFFFSDGQSVLIMTRTTLERDLIRSKLFARTVHLKEADALESSLKGNAGLSGKFMQLFTDVTPWDRAAAKWSRHEMTNFEYLMTINTLAGRSYNDLTQYPVFPWIIADYHSTELDLKAASTFRDLTKNMGSQNSKRRRAFEERYNAFAELDPKPFHFGTHYSSAMIVASYMIRLPPFIDSYLLLQGGRFDHADRLFYSVEKAWKSASEQSSTDVRELIPEFFYLPEMLTNLNKYAFGKKQTSDDHIDAVELPPWAKGSPELFIEKHRQALESDFVSKHLHHWIDLVFGYKQRGAEALENTNVFHNLSYKGSVDVDKIDDPLQRRAAIGIIHNFGQTPNQLFRMPHIARQRDFSHGLVSQLTSLGQMSVAALQIQGPVGSFMFDDGLMAFETHVAVHKLHRTILSKWSAGGTAISVVSPNGSLLGVFEQLHAQEIIASAALADTLILASADATMSAWTLKLNDDLSVSLACQAYLVGHQAPLSALAVSLPMRVIASGSVDGTVFIWDLNRYEPVRKFHCKSAVVAIAINHSTGDVAVASDGSVKLFTINGAELASFTVTERDVHFVYFQPGDVVAGAVRFLWVGRSQGLMDLLRVSVTSAEWEIELLKHYKHEHRDRSVADIKAVVYHDHQLITGDALGRVTRWVDRSTL
ncbi:hypothetical protein BCR37DRAFT_346699 [Protomyces lactucae-debilis]|uniref:Beige protein homolog 1 n=1 Tax=Protomyces lactucae-debilis TaxID=2754530 RepID=A0A1Y2FH77_PROLT|nr:uncharacterized protein BCR37DRAFT_346699 [Protomyces lactucae-debilis]ORY83308.1 hypothetical protein BCR37DRAFT_346699 [Protomyces lactucae-debilis]